MARIVRAATAVVVVMALVACGARAPRSRTTTAPPAALGGSVTLSIVGTNDLHGRLATLPLLGGYLANLRRARARDGGGVVLLDAGDMFHGTLESNLNEGAVVVAAYNALGYHAAVLGNHEFDFGPVGEAATPASADDDPRGALRARAREARFPFLAANLRYEATLRPIEWGHVAPSALFDVAGVRVGVVGLLTPQTPNTTVAANFEGLTIVGTSTTARAEAAALRARGAAVVIVVTHEGGACRDVADPRDLASCDSRAEVFALATALRGNGIDAIVGGHTHAAVAHYVEGVPVIESYAQGRAFGRVDLTVDLATHRVSVARIFPPRDLCAAPAATDGCVPGRYEGDAVVPDAVVAGVVAPALERARALRDRPLGVRVATAVRRAYADESALGNLVADMMRGASPGADVAITNGGGLRADLPPGELTYGALYEALPFDNRLVRIQLRAGELRQILAGHLGLRGGIVSLSGVRAVAACVGGLAAVRLSRENGAPIRDDEALTVVTTDFLATGGDGLFAARPAASAPGALQRDAVAAQLAARGAVLAGDDRALFDPARPRLVYPAPRPMDCR